MELIDSEQQIIAGNRLNDSHSFPDNWQLCSLGEITFSSQYGISSSAGGNYSVPILKMNNLQDGHIDLRNLDYIRLSKAEMESLLLNKGDLLINRTNSSDLVGKAAIYDLAGEHVFASYLVRFRLGPSVLPAFVNYFLNSGPGQSKLKLLATKGVSQANINPSILKRRLFVPIPPILEQYRIVEILCDLDHSINLITQLIAKKRNIKQATMQQLLTGKTRLPGFSGELKPAYKQTEVGEIPENWSVKRLEELASWKGGATPSMANANFWINGTIYWASSGDIKTKILSKTASMISEIAVKQSSTTLLQEGAILIVTRSGILRKYLPVAKNVVPVAINQDIKALIPNSQISADYLLQILSERGPDILSTCMKSGTTVESIEYIWLRKYQIPLPPPPEQQAIAAILSDMDAEIAALEQKRDKTRALKQGMMQELLTGKTRLI